MKLKINRPDDSKAVLSKAGYEILDHKGDVHYRQDERGTRTSDHILPRWTIRNIDKQVKDEIVALAKHNGYTVERMIRELLEGYKK